MAPKKKSDLSVRSRAVRRARRRRQERRNAALRILAEERLRKRQVEEGSPYDRIQWNNSFPKSSEVEYLEIKPDLNLHFDYEDGWGDIPDSRGLDTKEKSLTSNVYDSIVVKSEPSYPDYEQFQKARIEDFSYSKNGKSNITNGPDMNKKPLVPIGSDTIVVKSEPFDPDYEKYNKNCIEDSTFSNVNEKKEIYLSSTTNKPVSKCRMNNKAAECNHLYQEQLREEVNQQRSDKRQCQQNSLQNQTVFILQNAGEIKKFTLAPLNNQLCSIAIPQQLFKMNNIKNSKRTYSMKKQNILQSVAATPAEHSGKSQERNKEGIGNWRIEKMLCQQNNASLKSEINKAFRTKITNATKDCDGPIVSLLSHPVDSVLKKHIVDILKQSDLESITMNGVIQKIFAMYPKFDLSYRKEFIKETLRFILYKLGEEKNSNNEVQEKDTDSPECCLTTTDNSDSISESVMECF